jgi:hypothetical protein
VEYFDIRRAISEVARRSLLRKAGSKIGFSQKALKSLQSGFFCRVCCNRSANSSCICGFDPILPTARDDDVLGHLRSILAN